MLLLLNLCFTPREESPVCPSVLSAGATRMSSYIHWPPFSCLLGLGLVREANNDIIQMEQFLHHLFNPKLKNNWSLSPFQPTFKIIYHLLSYCKGSVVPISTIAGSRTSIGPVVPVRGTLVGLARELAQDRPCFSNSWYIRNYNSS